ncbi:MAG: ATP-binding protein [Candidatus Marsarchaeota archaeon]|nr:ATP-binding protein [Candidatus Marsarchaeota archaeon]
MDSGPGAAPTSSSPPVGTVISTLEGTPNTNEFHFVIQGEGVKKGQFVQVQGASGPVLGVVVELSRSNRYFERAESVAEYERLGVLTAQFPTAEWEYMVAAVRVQGVLNGAHLARSSLPVAPGHPVHCASDEQLKTLLALDEHGLELGTLLHHTLPIRLSLSRLLQKHLAILAMSGAGKSYLAGVLIEELLDRPPAKGRVAVVVIDNHGEYAGFKDSPYRSRVQVLDGAKMRIGLRHLSASQLAEWSSMSAVARRALDAHVSALKKRVKETHNPEGLDELIEGVRSDAGLNKKENVRGPLLEALEELKYLRVIGAGDSFKPADVLKPGHLTVIDLSGVDSLRKKQILVAHYGRKLFRQRKKGLIPPYVMVVEEAHNFARERAEKHNALAKPIIETLAREGRKFGACLCLISQRPVQLSTTALSQCNSNIILRITNPFDLKHIGESCEGIDSRMLDSITSLRVGEALLLGEATGAPVFVSIRKRRSQTAARGESLEKLAQEFEDKNKRKEDEIEAFL